jgi:cytochrome c556
MKILLLLTFLLTPFISLASSIEDAGQAVRYRQSAYFLIRMNTDPLAQMMMGKTEFDAEKFRHYAERVAMLARFPTDGFEQNWLEGKTKAKKEIWENKADFDDKMQTFVDATEAMASISKKGTKSEMFNAFKKMGKACKACHKKYRYKDD